MRRLPPLNALRTFEVVARLSSVTEAANELNVSHSSVSHQVKQMEEYFGQELFVREGRGLRPTKEAVEFAAELRESFDRIAFSAAQLMQYGKQRGISINATPSFTVRWLIPKTNDFQIINPMIPLKFTTSTSDEVKDLKEPFDVIFRRDVMKRTGHQCIRMLDDIQMPVMAPSYYEKHKPKSPKDLAGMTLLHMRSRPHVWTQWFSWQKIKNAGTDAGPVFDHFFLSLQAAIAGHGVAIGSLALVEEDLAEGRLVAPFQARPVEGPGFHVLYKKSFADEAAGRQFLGWLAKTTGAKL